MGSEDLADNTEMWYSHCLRTAAVRMRCRIGLNEKEWVQEHIKPFYDSIIQAVKDGDFLSAIYAFESYNQASRWLQQKGA